MFGDYAADMASAADTFACADLYHATPDGLLERRQRPLRLQADVLARVPAWTDPWDWD